MIIKTAPHDILNFQILNSILNADLNMQGSIQHIQ